MKKTTRTSALTAILIALLLLCSSVVTAFAANVNIGSFNDDIEYVTAISYPEGWVATGESGLTDEEILNKTMEIFGGAEYSAGSEGITLADGVFSIAYNEEKSAVFSATQTLYTATQYPEGITEAETKKYLASCEGLADSVEAYGENKKFVILTVDQSEDNNATVVYAQNISGLRTITLNISSSDAQYKEELVSDMKSIIDSLEYADDECEIAIDDIGVTLTLDNLWQYTGQDVSDDNPLLESLGSTADELSASMKETDRYFYGERAPIDENDTYRILCTYAYDSDYSDYSEYELSTIKQTAQNTASSFESYIDGDEITDITTYVADAREFNGTSYMVLCYFVVYGDGSVTAENYACTVVNGVYYEYYYYEYVYTEKYTKLEDQISERFYGILNSVQYGDPTAELTNVSEYSGIDIAGDIAAIYNMEPQFTQFFNNWMANLPVLVVALAAIGVVGVITAVIVIICHFAAKSRRKKREAAQQQ